MLSLLCHHLIRASLFKHLSSFRRVENDWSSVIDRPVIMVRFVSRSIIILGDSRSVIPSLFNVMWNGTKCFQCLSISSSVIELQYYICVNQGRKLHVWVLVWGLWRTWISLRWRLSVAQEFISRMVSRLGGMGEVVWSLQCQEILVRDKRQLSYIFRRYFTWATAQKLVPCWVFESEPTHTYV